MIDDDSWVYDSEGGKHALFSSTSAKWKGRLLRVRRDTLVGRSNSSSDTVDASCEYLRRIVHPLLEPYFDLPEVVELLPHTARKLFDLALQSKKVPVSRIKMWTKEPEAKGSQNGSVVATLLRDYKLIVGYEDSCWSFEIKPKGGYLAFSPLVNPLHRLKYERTRFWIQQQLLIRGAVKKGWSCTVTQPSEYNPLDFFSGDEARMENAMAALLENPQNNLKVWDNNSLLIGHGVMKTSIEEAKCLLSALSLILREECLVSRLLRLQMLDVIDGDGAVMIYDHLLTLCHGDEIRVHEMLDVVPVRTAAGKSSGCLAASPFHRPKSELLDRFLLDVEVFSSKASTLQERDSAYCRSQGMVCVFSETDCVFLLRNWLLSLAMCDVSILVAIAPTDMTKHVAPKQAEWQFKRPHGDSHYGLLGSGSSEWVYTIKIVDCDNKPASKLSKRGKKEELIRTL
jgi:Inositol-pentakisphosphate 2-kinase